MRRLVWSPRSRQDLIGIAEYYDRIDPTLAADMVDRVEAGPAPLLDSAGIGSPAAAGTRKWRVPGTPFLLFYDAGDDAIEIVAVLHVRSDYPR